MKRSHKERWRPVKDFPLYEVSDQGRLRMLAYMKPNRWGTETLCAMKLCNLRTEKPEKGGYVYAWLLPAPKENRKFCYLHRLVAQAFLGGPTEGQVLVMHKDDNPINNHWKNLQWGSHLDNQQDKVRKGRQANGSRNGQSVLTEEQVADIWWWIRFTPASSIYIAKMFGVSDVLVRKIGAGAVWTHVTGLPKLPDTRPRRISF